MTKSLECINADEAALAMAQAYINLEDSAKNTSSQQKEDIHWRVSLEMYSVALLSRLNECDYTRLPSPTATAGRKMAEIIYKNRDERLIGGTETGRLLSGKVIDYWNDLERAIIFDDYSVPEPTSILEEGAE